MLKLASLLCVLGLVSTTVLLAQKPLLVVPTGHSSGTSSFTVSADGKYFLTLGGDNLVKLWNEDAKEIRTFKTPEFRYTSVKFSPDHRFMLAISCYSHTDAWILDITTGKVLDTLRGHTGALRIQEYSNDGRWIATGSQDSTAILWDAQTGNMRYRLKGHQNAVISVVFSPDGKWLATLSADKTVKIWEISTGRLLQTLEVEGDFPSEIQCAPDGKTLSVVTGWGKDGISLWSTGTWKRVQQLDGYSFRFSPDGQWVCIFREGAALVYPSNDLKGKPFRELHATVPPSDGPIPITVTGGYFMPDSKGMLLSSMMGNPEVYDIESGKRKLCLQGYAVGVETVCFSPDSKKCLMASGAHLLEWDFVQGGLAKRFKGMEGKITNAAYSPDGQKVVSVTDNSNGAIWDEEQGEKLQALAQVIGMFPPQDYVRVLALPVEGSYFLRGHSMGGKEGPPFLSTWSFTNGSQVDSLFYPFGDNSLVSDAAYSPDGKRLAVVVSNALLIWDLNTRKWEQLAQSDTLVFKKLAFYGPSQIAVATSDNTLQFWDIQEKKMLDTAFLGEYHVEYDPFNYTEKTTKIPFSAGNAAGSAFFSNLVSSSDHQWLAVGVDKSIVLFSNDGETPPQLVHVFEGHNNQVLQLDFSADSRRLISVSLDKTARIWDLEKQEEMARLILLNQNDWSVTTPSGLFDASPGAMEQMYFLVGEEVIELEQLKERYYEPGLLSKLMGFASGELRNVEAFQNLALFPEIQAEIKQNQLVVKLTERNGGLGKLSLFVNDKEVAENVNPSLRKTLSIDLKAYEKYYRSDTLNTIALRAYNAGGWLKSQAYKLPYAYARAKGQGGVGETPTLGDAKPRLFAIMVGTADYSGEKLDLKYADQDATAMAQAISAAGKELFGEDVNVQTFTTSSLGGDSTKVSQPISSKTNIQKAFESLARQAQPGDVLVLYFSGHGITYGEAEKAQFYYLTKDIASEDLSDPEVRARFTISSDELTEWIKNIPALKQVLILDACNSGKIVESLASLAQKELNPSQVRALERMKDRTGMFILTGSAADKVSYEASQYGQGLLTYSLLQGMSGLALTDDKRVDVMTLFQYSRDKVPELAKSINGIQTPTLAFPVGGGSFDIGIVNDKVKIPLAQLKPVFIRNVFQDEDAYDDSLGLSEALEDFFRKQTAKGAQGKLIYIDVKEYENAYSLKGRYKVTGNEVLVKARLFKGRTSIADDIRVTGKKDDLPGLVKQILGQVMPLAK